MALNGILAFFNLGTGEIIAIVVIVLLLFGGKKIPELMHGLGKGVKTFKAGMKDAEKDIEEIRAEIVKDDEPKKADDKKEEK